MPTFDAIVLAGGSGKRFSPTSTPKQFQLIQDIPVFIHSIHAFLAMGLFRQIDLVVGKEDPSLALEETREYLSKS